MNQKSKKQPTPINPGLLVSGDQPKWYALYTRSRFEKKVQHELEQSKFEVFLPLIKVKRVWSDRLKTVSTPLLPGYVFVKLCAHMLRQVLYYPGVVRIVSFGDKPCEVREKEIILLEKIITHGFPVESIVQCGVGDMVRIVRGPLKGWEGKVESTKGTSRIVFQIASIQQCLSVEVGMGDIERVS